MLAGGCGGLRSLAFFDLAEDVDESVFEISLFAMEFDDL